MKSKSDFWLTLHELASDLEKEGKTDSEQGESICEVYNALSLGTRAVYLANLNTVMSTLAEVAKQCKAQP